MFNIDEYRNQILDILKKNNYHYPSKKIDVHILNNEISYYRWLHPYQGDWEIKSLFTSEIISNLSKIIKPNTTVIDIGAQTGNMSVAYSIFAKKVISFEPNPAAFEILQKNADINSNIIPYNYAISDEEGPLTFHYSDYGFCNGGFATRTNFGIGVTGHKIPIDVYAVNLEKFIEENNIDIGNISLIKIDAEGHDKDILKSIKNIIQQHKPIIITEIYNGLSRDEIIDLLSIIEILGYKAYDEEINHLNIDNLGKQIKSIHDINPGSGHNLICIHDT